MLLYSKLQYGQLCWKAPLTAWDPKNWNIRRLICSSFRASCRGNEYCAPIFSHLLEKFKCLHLHIYARNPEWIVVSFMSTLQNVPKVITAPCYDNSYVCWIWTKGNSFLQHTFLQKSLKLAFLCHAIPIRQRLDECLQSLFFLWCESLCSLNLSQKSTMVSYLERNRSFPAWGNVKGFTPGTRKVFRHWNVKVSFHEPLDFFGIWEGKTISRGDEKSGPVLTAAVSILGNAISWTVRLLWHQGR